MAQTQYEHRGRVAHEGIDMVKHLYNRRSLWGSETMLYRARHPMEWSRVEGTYQNWGVDVSSISSTDASSADGEAAKLFASEDLTVWLSRRRNSMPFFFRNCNADELHVVLRGAMVYETEFGSLDASDGDLIVIPKGITYRVSMAGEQDTLRFIYESAPEVFLIPAEMVDHVYGKGRPAVSPDRLQYPSAVTATDTPGSYQVRVKYAGAFSEFLGETSTINYDFDPLATEIVDGCQQVFKFGIDDVERLGSTPIPFIGGAYLDNKANLAWALHMTQTSAGGGSMSAPVHRNPDVDELRITATGPRLGSIEFTPQGVDHGYGRGYTVRERNLPLGPDEGGARLSLYSGKALKGTSECFKAASPIQC